jgi:hypothetical protein
MIETMNFTNLNGATIDLNDEFLPLNSFTITVDTRMTEKERSQQHGLYPSNTYLGKLIIHCEGDLLEVDSASYWERRLNLINAIMPRPQMGKKSGDLIMFLSGWDEAVTCECTIDGWPEMPLGGASPSRGTFMVNFKAFDPRLYGYVQTLPLNSQVFDNAGGRDYPHVYPRVYSGGSTVSSGKVRNLGNIETYPVAVFKGPAVSPYLVINRSDGSTIYFKLNGLQLPTTADTATVDFLRRTVTGAQGQNYYNYALDNDWWSIEPLPILDTVSYYAYSSGTGSQATITWRNAYLI